MRISSIESGFPLTALQIVSYAIFMRALHHRRQQTAPFNPVVKGSQV